MEFNSAMEDGMIKVAIWGLPRGTQVQIKIYIDGDVFFVKSGGNYAVERFYSPSPYGRTVEISVDVSGRGIPWQYGYGSYTQRLNTGGGSSGGGGGGTTPTKDPRFDIRVIGEELKVAVWDCPTRSDIYIYINGRYFDGFYIRDTYGHLMIPLSDLPKNQNVIVEVDCERDKCFGPYWEEELSFYNRGLEWVTITGLSSGYGNTMVSFNASTSGVGALYSVTQRSYSHGGTKIYAGKNTWTITPGSLSSKGDLPKGTCYIVDDSTHKDLSHAFYAIQKQTFTQYTGEYSTSFYMGTQEALSFRSLTDDWRVLVNGLYYVSSAERGYMDSTIYNYTWPTSGKVITAGIYNELIKTVDNFRYRGMTDVSIPNVRRGEVISKYFISRIGRAYNDSIDYLIKRNKNELGI